MHVRDEITKAIGAHGSWKQKLRTAIDTGQAESTPDRVKKDHHCSFGKWLHQRIDPVAKESPYYKKVVDLHADFHREAGSILELALSGAKDEANEQMKIGGRFSQLSGSLTATMKKWHDSV